MKDRNVYTLSKMDAKLEIIILNYCLLYFVFEHKKINIKCVTGMIKTQMNKPTPEIVEEIRNRVKGIKKGIGLIYSKKLKVAGHGTIYRDPKSKYISMSEILNVIEDPYRFIAFKQHKNNWTICYTRNDPSNIIVTHNGIFDTDYESDIRGGYFIISKKKFGVLRRTMKMYKDKMKEVDFSTGKYTFTCTSPWKFFRSWKIHKIDQLKTIATILNEVDDGIEYITDKLYELHDLNDKKIYQWWLYESMYE